MAVGTQLGTTVEEPVTGSTDLQQTSSGIDIDGLTKQSNTSSFKKRAGFITNPDLQDLLAYSTWRTEIRRRLAVLSPSNLRQFLWDERITIVITLAAVIPVIVLQETAWSDLSDDAWYTIWTTFLAIVAMVRGVADPDICLFFTTTLLLLKGIITPKDAFAGFSNDSIVTIALMIALAFGLEAVGALEYVPELVLGRSRWEWVGQARMFSAVAGVSAFMNNTPLVAVMIPVVQKWCRANNQHPSRFMMPLSYAAILGGLCTIIGTSTNLILKGLVENDFKNVKLGFFEPGVIGLPIAVAGLLYVVVAAPWLLPKRDTLVESVAANPREYMISVTVDSRYPFVGRTIEAAGLRHLQSIFLVDIVREDTTAIPAPAPDTVILEGDKLTFAGDVLAMKTVLTLPGMQPVASLGLADPEQPHIVHERVLVEAVVALSSPLVGMTIKESQFRTRYGAVILAMARNGERIGGNGLGDTVVLGGDTMLLETTEQFLKQHRNSNDFALVADCFRLAVPKRDPVKLFGALAMFITMIVINSLDIMELSSTALACLFGFFLFGFMTVQQFRDSIPGMILLTVAGAFGIARALTVTKVADRIAKNLVTGFAAMGTAGPIFALYLTCVVLTALLSNGASVTLLYPLAKAVAKTSGVPLKALIYAIMIAASSDFSTPIGYQTNLMVSGPGGYTFLDYTRFGISLQVITGVITVVICNWYFAK